PDPRSTRTRPDSSRQPSGGRCAPLVANRPRSLSGRQTTRSLGASHRDRTVSWARSGAPAHRRSPAVSSLRGGGATLLSAAAAACPPYQPACHSARAHVLSPYDGSSDTGCCCCWSVLRPQMTQAASTTALG